MNWSGMAQRENRVLQSLFRSDADFLRGKGECTAQVRREGVHYYCTLSFHQQCTLTDYPSPARLHTVVSLSHPKGEFSMSSITTILLFTLTMRLLLVKCYDNKKVQLFYSRALISVIYFRWLTNNKKKINPNLKLFFRLL